MLVIKFCENNFVHGTEDVVEKLKENFDAKIIVDSCLGFCGDCTNGSFALVNNELIEAESPEELYDVIAETLE